MPIPFTFDATTHICRDLQGRWIPTVSQVQEAMHLSFDFRKHVDGDLLDRRSLIGTQVHDLTDLHDKYGDVDPGWLTEDTAGYLESYASFKRISDFVPRQWSTRRCELINGLALSGETDKEGLLGKHEAIIDLKTGTTVSDGWGFQTNGYEMLKYRSPKVGRVIRAVAHLQRDGSPGKLVEFGEFSLVDGISYADTFLAGLHCMHAAIRRGYLTERDFIEKE